MTAWILGVDFHFRGFYSGCAEISCCRLRPSGTFGGSKQLRMARAGDKYSARVYCDSLSN